MSSLLPGFEYDIFISYRHNDNLEGWVTDFVTNLENQLRATIKEPVSIYFDRSPYDGLLETHNVNESLRNKIKSLIFIPVLSQTYCDETSYAWAEFCEFNVITTTDAFGLNVRLGGGNVASRILPIKIHDIDPEDKALLERKLGTALRSVEFIFKSAGVNRPLQVHEDHTQDNINKIYYRDQVNKVANAVKDIVYAMKREAGHAGSRDVGTVAPIEKAPIAKKKNRAVFVLIPVAVLIAIGIFYWLHTAERTPEIVSDEKPSIIVLPFANLSNDPSQDYFSEGIADEIRTGLSSINRLKVISRNASIYFKGKDASIRQISETLKVDHVLTGSIQKLGEELKISVELSNAQTDAVEWSFASDLVPLDNIFNLQREIGIQVAKQLRVNLSEQDVANSFRRYTSDPKLYDRFLRVWKSLELNGDGLALPVQELHEIIAENPDYVPALKTLAFTYLIRGAHGLPNDSVRQGALPLFNRARELDETDQVLPSLYGFFKLYYEWDFKEVEKIGRRGLALNDYNSIQLLAELYMKLGNLGESLRMAKLIGDVNPLSDGIYYTTRYKMLAGEYEQAEKEMKEYIASKPDFVEPYRDLGLLYIVEGKNHEAIDILETAIKRFNYKRFYLYGYLAIGYRRVGREKEFNDVLRILKARYESGETGSPAFYVGLVYCNIGMVDDGMKWMEKSFEAHDIEMSWLKMDPMFEPVKNDPRYISLIKRAGFNAAP